MDVNISKVKLIVIEDSEGKKVDEFEISSASKISVNDKIILVIRKSLKEK